MSLMQSIQDHLKTKQIYSQVAFPKRRMPRLLEPTVMLCVSERKMLPFCFGNLIGQEQGKDVFALHCSETVVCEIYSPYLSGGYQCDILTDTVFLSVSEILSERVLNCVTRTPTYYDPDTDCFRSSIVVESGGWVESFLP